MSVLQRRRAVPLLALLCLLLLGGCGSQTQTEKGNVVTSQEELYAGLVEVPSGYGSTMYVEKYDDVPLSGFTASQFTRTGDKVRYTGSDVHALQGIDVSEHQGQIDWAAVAEDGVNFAMIRAGYRGYSEGGLYEDNCFRTNMKEAVENGLLVGVYFFSQATSEEEAAEEAEFVLSLLDGYYPSLGIYYDWERIEFEDARTDAVEGDELTAFALKFCDAIDEAGYNRGVYAYRTLAYYYYDLSALADCRLWIGAVGDYPDFYYAHTLWQYSESGTVDGIDGSVDRDLLFFDDDFKF